MASAGNGGVETGFINPWVYSMITRFLITSLESAASVIGLINL